ncbi:hypothetical protein FHP25_02735 [Vineibacter terrae]|uniref:Uncharacterized protein n=1 Tax=Vineibacter terrae TaxID=2586908 RepID=A0A5C8PVB6_9HYPH|nr:hypothetical protein [Vineibacter terrae]TXL82001.1 hypothetical protein FHP25_02735 [Vineibacter terrae]
MIRIATKPTIAALLAALAAAGCAAGPQSPPVAAADPAPAPQQALMALNKQARANYADGKREMLLRARPAIVVAFDDATLLRADAPAQTESFTPPLYHRYKEVAHLPLGLWSTLAPWVDRPGQTAWRAPLQALLERARAARATLEGVGFPPDRLGRQQQIFDRSIALMEATLAAGRPDKAALAAFAQAMAAPVLANGDDAAALQIDGLHAVVGSWRGALTAAQWRQLHVLVLGPKMPRADNLAMQYFERVMGRAERDRRLLYAEGIFDRDGALSLLGTVVTDRALAQAFFGDPMRMDRDFLSDGARKRLDQIFGRQAP